MKKEFDTLTLAIEIEKMMEEHPDWTRYQIIRWLRDLDQQSQQSPNSRGKEAVSRLFS